MPTLRVSTRGEALRLVARTSATGSVEESLSITLGVLDSLDVPVTIWRADAGRWTAHLGNDPVSDPAWGDHEGWNVVPVVVGGDTILAVMMTPSTRHEDLDLLETIADIVTCTAMRVASEERHEDQRQTSEVLERLSEDGSFSWDLTSGAVHWSSQLRRLHGLPVPGDAIGYGDWIDLVHPDDRTAVQDQHLTAIGSGCAWSGVHRIARRDDGAVRHILTRGQVLVDDAGVAVRLVGVCRDLTDLPLRPLGHDGPVAVARQPRPD